MVSRMANPTKLLGAALACAALACATPGTSEPGAVGANRPIAERDGLHLELIEKMLDRGRPHAALAHLDALEPEASARAEARLLRAESLRRLGRVDEADAVYRELLGSEVAALAHRGLGRIAADAGDVERAVAEMRRARDLRPTSDRIRNDLGYALLLAGDHEAARVELVTALELGGGERVARNLLLLLLLEDRIGAAESFAREHDIDAPSVSRLWRHAQALRERGPKGDGS